MTQTAPRTAFEELRSYPNWVVWKRATRNGKVTKVPYNAYTGEMASSTDKDTWASYERASETFARSKGKYAGIGFMFGHSPFFGCDCDHCIDENGAIDQWAQDVLDQLNTYGEKSPSETGIHGIGRGEMPEAIDKKTGETSRPGMKRPVKGQRASDAVIELYSEGRYFTWTGNHVESTHECINDAQDALTAIHQRFTAPPQKEKSSRRPRGEQRPLFLTDEQIIAKAQSAKNGATFNDLWNGGLSGHLSASEADLAFCNLLAFWCGKDTAIIDRIFRRSGLYRDKWDEKHGAKTYGEMTIDTAIDSCSETYSGYARMNARPGATNGNSYSSNENGHDEARPMSDDEEKPRVVIGRQLTEMVNDAIKALACAEADNPTIFVQANKLVKVAIDKKRNRHIILHMGTPEIRAALARSANYYRLKEKGGAWYEVPITPPTDIVESVVSPENPGAWPFHPLDAIVGVPVIRPNGTIVDAPGYDAETMIYYAPTPDLKHCQIPQKPSKQDAIDAMAKIENIIAEFPFAEQADRANALAAMLTPFIRQSLRETDDVPLGVLDAASPSTGKGLLASVISLLATGLRMSAMPAPDSEEEWDKKIVTELIEGNTFIVIDNIPGILKSAKLEAVLTARYYKGRILGRSQSANPENRATWLATGNNLKLAGDLPERCYWIRMVAPTSDPEARVFTIPDLMEYVIEHRCELVTAILTVIRAWYVAGKPLDKRLGNFRTFTTWSNTVGSILHYAGIEGFLSDRIRRKDEIDVDRKQWAKFLRAWYEKFGSDGITSGQIKQAISAGSATSLAGSDEVPDFFFALPEDLQALYSEHPEKFSARLGKALEKRLDRRFGAENFYLQRGVPNRKNVSTWKVVAWSAGSDSTPNAGGKNENDFSSHDNVNTTEKNQRNSGRGNSLHSMQEPLSCDSEMGVNQPVKPSHEKEGSAGSQNTLPASESTPCTQPLTPDNAVNYPYDVIAALDCRAPYRACMRCQYTNWLPWYNDGTWQYQCGDCNPALRSSRGRDKFFTEEQVNL